MKNYFSRLVLALGLALVMGLGFAGVALANPPAALPNLGITKNLDTPNGAVTPATTFSFRLTQAQPVGGGNAPTDLVNAAFEVMPTPTATIGADRSISYPAGYFGLRQTELRLNNAAGFNTSASFTAGDIDILFPNAGVFHFFVEEMRNTNNLAADNAANPNALGTLTYSTAVYMMTLEVRNVDGQLRVTHVIGQPATPGTPGSDGTPGQPGTEDRWVLGPKGNQFFPGTDPQPGTPPTDSIPGIPGTIVDPSEFLFRNIFTRNIITTDPDAPAFAVTKTVVDTTGLSDLTTVFPTATTLIIPSQVFDQPGPNPTLTASATGVRVVSGTPGVNVTPQPTIGISGTGTAADPFVVTANLLHGQRLIFPELPAGTTFGSTETQDAEFTGEGRVFVAGTQIGTPFGDVTDNNLAGDDVVVPNQGTHFVSAAEPFNNRIDFINDYVHADNTGLVITSMPMLAVLIAATVFLAMMVASRSRQRAEQMPAAF